MRSALLVSLFHTRRNKGAEKSNDLPKRSKLENAHPWEIKVNWGETLKGSSEILRGGVKNTLPVALSVWLLASPNLEFWTACLPFQSPTPQLIPVLASYCMTHLSSFSSKTALAFCLALLSVKF